MQFVREYGHLLESDLSLYHNGLDILDWIRWAFRGEGSLTSRKLLNLIWGLPDKSETMTALRDGDWTEAQYIQARIANELMLSRADFASAYGGRMDPNLLQSPKQAREEAEERAAAQDVRTLIRAQVHGEFIAPARPGIAFEGEVQDGKVRTEATP